jgi:hypothetical protein
MNANEKAIERLVHDIASILGNMIHMYGVEIFKTGYIAINSDYKIAYFPGPAQFSKFLAHCKLDSLNLGATDFASLEIWKIYQSSITEGKLLEASCYIAQELSLQLLPMHILELKYIAGQSNE